MKTKLTIISLVVILTLVVLIPFAPAQAANPPSYSPPCTLRPVFATAFKWFRIGDENVLMQYSFVRTLVCSSAGSAPAITLPTAPPDPCKMNVGNKKPGHSDNRCKTK
jgi:hypothetical protein